MTRFTFGVLLCLFAGAPVQADEVVASRTLRVGDVLTMADLRVLGDTAGSERLEAFVGKEVRRAIYAGRLVSTADLGPRTMVQRNDIVTMLYESGNLGLRTQGRALGSGGMGEMVEIMNLDTRLTVRARITGTLTVEVAR